MNLLSTLLWILAGCILFVLLALLISKAFVWFFGKMAAREQKNREEGRVGRWMFIAGFLPWFSFVYQATTFFDSWAVKLTIFIPGTVVAVMLGRAFIRSLKKQRLEEQPFYMKEAK